MAKPLLLAIAPVQSQSGYGKHSADLIRCLIRMDKFDVKILPIRWGNTPLNALEPGRDDEIISRMVNSPQLPKRPEVTFQVSVPNEFQPMGEFNIGVTAGIETTIVPATWLEGMNRMNMNIVPSEFAKRAFMSTGYTKNHPQTKQPVGQLKLERPIEVIFEGCDISTYYRKEDKDLDKTLKDKLSFVSEDWAYLVVGHWLQGAMGHDRKDIGMTVQIFLETFKNMQNAPALILKTSSATFSVMDRNEMLRRLNEIKNNIKGADSLPNIYLLHGQLTDDEMNDLYNHPKVKAMITLTKGEGFGRPILEFSMTGKPIIASAWSGHMDFLDKDLTVLLPGKVDKVHPSAHNDFILKDSQWFTADYNVAGGAMMEIFKHYNKYASKGRKMSYFNKNNFGLTDMCRKINWFFEKNVPEFAEELDLKLPASANKLKTITLPKLKKAGV